jgi:hypothetical protein
MGRGEVPEALSKELGSEWGIKLTCIEPGGFRTDWAGRSMIFADRHPAYDNTIGKESMEKRHGNQAGDPKEGAKGMYVFSTMQDPPLRVAVGTDTYKGIMNRLKMYDENYSEIQKA